MGNYIVDETQSTGFRGGDGLGGEDHPKRALSTDQPRKSLRAAERRRKSEIDLGFAEFSAVAGDCERRGLGDFAARAMGEPVDRSDDRLWECLDPAGHPLPAAYELSQDDCLPPAHAVSTPRHIAPSRTLR